MKNTNLNDELAKVAGGYPNRVALVGKGGSTSYEALVSLNWSEEHKIVAICCKQLENTVAALVVLDGRVDGLCALPADLSDEAMRSILEQASFDAIVTDLEPSERCAFAECGLAIVDVSRLRKDEKTSELSADRKVKTTWLVPTSGTTATPKLVVHSFESLAQSALKHSAVSDTPQVWGLFYDVTRFAGLQVLLQSLLAGHTLVASDFDSSLEAKIAFCAAHSVTHISATPTLWRKVLMSSAKETLDLRQITLGGEAADQTVLNSLRKAFPAARITHIYASTEAGAALSVSDGLAGYPVGHLGKNIAGKELKVRDGQLAVRSISAAHGYSQDQSLLGEDGWIDTGDLVRLEDTRFYIIGRASGTLNVGGDKVVPEIVRHALLECEYVEEAVVYGKPNPFTGTLVGADIVLKKNADQKTAKAALDEFLKARLTAAQRPRVLRFVDQITTNSTGKVMQEKKHERR